MTKNDMVLKIAKEMRMHQTDVKRIVQMTLDGIIQVLATIGRLELRNFGVFESKTRKRRKARNPRTGQEVIVEEHKSVSFKPGKFMTDRINGRTSGGEGEDGAKRPPRRRSRKQAAGRGRGAKEHGGA